MRPTPPFLPSRSAPWKGLDTPKRNAFDYSKQLGAMTAIDQAGTEEMERPGGGQL
jgi:hypothetical protein